MKVGNLKLYIFPLFLFFITTNLNAEEKVNLNILQPTFEEEPESGETTVEGTSNIKSKKNS